MRIGDAKWSKSVLLALLPKCCAFSIIMFLSMQSAYAQKNLINLGLGDLAGQLHWNNTIQPPASDIEGSPYLNEEFEIGDVIYGNEYKLNQIPLRYNIYNDDIEYKVENAIMAFANPHKIDKVIFNRTCTGISHLNRKMQSMRIRLDPEDGSIEGD